MRRWGVLPAALLLTACATAPPMIWARIDGQPVQQPDQHNAWLQCRGEAATAAANSPGAAYPNIYMVAAANRQRDETIEAVMQGCMSKRGYIFVQAPAPR